MSEPQTPFLAAVERELGAESFIDQFLDLGIMLPLRLCDEHPGSVIDAEAEEIFVVDPNNERSDEDCAAIAALLVEAVNAAGGFEGENGRG